MIIRKLLLSFLFSLLISTFSFSANFTVTSTADAGPGTLREAIGLAALTLLESDIIDFNLPPGSIITLSSRLRIENDPFGNGGYTTIQGPGADLLTISGDGTFPLFEIRNGDIYNVTLTQGFSDNSHLASAVGTFGDGGRTILNGVIINNCQGTMGTVQMNASGGHLGIYNSVISGNFGANNGCGVKHAAYNGALIDIRNSTITGNQALFVGGGVHNESAGPLNLYNSIVAFNLAQFGGADINGLITLGTNLIGVDPLFVMNAPPAPTAGGDFHLQDGSPAHNMGVNGDVPPMSFGLMDIEGNPRIIETTVDLGAFEKLPPPDIDVTKTDDFLDENGNGIVNYGETIRYTIEISNAAMVSDALDVVFDSSVDPNTSLVVGSVISSQGSITTGDTPGDNSVSVDIGTLTSGATVIITFDVTVTFAGSGNFVSCQGTVSGSNFEPVLTDDPAEAGDMDPTITPIPTLSQWGIIVLSVIMLIFGIVAVRQRKPAVIGG